MIGIVDYGVGNVLAFANMYKRMNVRHRLLQHARDFADVDRIVLPGVGSFDFAMSRLTGSGLRAGLDTAVNDRKLPVLGVCVGMQMLADSSDEGELPGLSWVPGTVKRFERTAETGQLDLPHMGWNRAEPSRDAQLFRGLGNDAWFYFLHSYHFVCSDSGNELATCDYGGRFACAVSNGNIYGVQFHPEKSHDTGATLLKNFSEV